MFMSLSLLALREDSIKLSVCFFRDRETRKAPFYSSFCFVPSPLAHHTKTYILPLLLFLPPPAEPTSFLFSFLLSLWGGGGRSRRREEVMGDFLNSPLGRGKIEPPSCFSSSIPRFCAPVTREQDFPLSLLVLPSYLH